MATAFRCRSMVAPPPAGSGQLRGMLLAAREAHVAAADSEREALDWQVGVWNRISALYLRDIDQRFEPVVDGVIERAQLAAGERVLDLGTGTGAVAERAAALVGPRGHVAGVDLSSDMLTLARQRMEAGGVPNVALHEGRAESIPADADSFDVVLSSLVLMYVIDRPAAAGEIARVLRPGGRFVASVWGAPAECDIVLFQATAGQFAGPPPVAGVGPGALADTAPFVQQLDAAGIEAHVEAETLGFEFPDFASAWEALAGVTTAGLPPARQREAQQAVKDAMYPEGDGPRNFRNRTQFVVGRARA